MAHDVTSIPVHTVDLPLFRHILTHAELTSKNAAARTLARRILNEMRDARA